MLDRFSKALRETVEMDEQLHLLMDAADEAIQPERISVWMRSRT